MITLRRAGAILFGLALSGALGATGCTDEPKEASEILRQIDRHFGERVVMKARFRPGIRCHLETEGGEWRTYCGNCQVCRGPYVVDLPDEGFEEWPMVLAGTWKQRDIRCAGPLNQVECYPLEVGKTYVVEGVLERSTPPRLYVDRFEEVEEPGT